MVTVRYGQGRATHGHPLPLRVGKELVGEKQERNHGEHQQHAPLVVWCASSEFDTRHWRRDGCPANTTHQVSTDDRNSTKGLCAVCATNKQHNGVFPASPPLPHTTSCPRSADDYVNVLITVVL